MYEEVRKVGRTKWNDVGHDLWVRSLASHTATKVNAIEYQELLQQHVIPSLGASPTHSFLYKMNAPCHTAKWVKQFLEADNIKVMKWPAQSPVLNPIKNLWKVNGIKIMTNKPTTVTKLCKKLEEEGNRIISEQCEKHTFLWVLIWQSLKARASVLPTNVLKLPSKELDAIYLLVSSTRKII